MTKLQEFDAAAAKSGYDANRLLFQWLSDDEARAALYRELLGSDRVLEIQSRADTKRRQTDDGDSEFHQNLYLLTARDDIRKALTDDNTFSNEPYSALGSGTFMLGLDPANPDHAKQRAFAIKYLDYTPATIKALATVAFMAGAVLALKRWKFDLAALAEQAALRFVGFLFGFEQGGHPYLEEFTRRAFRGLNYQIVGRHFVSEPGIPQAAVMGMGGLLQMAAAHIDVYRAQVSPDQVKMRERLKTELEELQQFTDRGGNKPLDKFEPVLKRIGESSNATGADYSGNEIPVIITGLIAGTVGNIQSAVAIAIREFFKDPAVLDAAHKEAVKSFQADRDYGATAELQSFIWEALRLNPPAAFLPRRMKKGELVRATLIPAGSVVLLAMGGATRDRDNSFPDPDKFRPDRGAHQDPFIFGGTDTGPAGIHECLGKHLAMPPVVHFVRQLLLQPGLTESLDPVTGSALPFEKDWGIIARSYPFEYRREKRLLQSPLIVVMKVRQPLFDHAEALKKVIKYGAPRIEKKLAESAHVHFAQFLFIENDSKLVLFTIYDRDFDSYIEHFADEIGPLFDRIFEHIEDAPPMPVDKFPKEFVDTIRRYNARPAADYFFSAYPSADVAMITKEFNK